MLTFVLLKGWGFNANVMAPLRDALQHHFPNARYIIPRQYCSSIQLDDDLVMWRNTWLPNEARVISHERVCYVGWSLGGILASRLAVLPDAHTAALLTLGTNRCFMANKQWPYAMPQADFDGFFQAWQRRPKETLRHFTRMASQGCATPHLLRSTVTEYVNTALTLEVGQRELGWLRDSDALDYWIKKQYPCRHLFATQDALVPHAAAKALAACSNVAVLPDAGHLLPLTHAAHIAADCAALLHNRPTA